MAYQLSFFCRADEENGAAAMDRVLDALLEDGSGLYGEYIGPPRPGPVQWEGPEQEAIAAFRLATSPEGPERLFDDLLLEIHVGVRFIAETVIAADPDDEHGVWGSDLLAIITLSGERPDWALVERIWTIVESVWSAVPWDETSGFDVAQKTRRPLHEDTGRHHEPRRTGRAARKS
ncbi:hypothetical protein [Actinomadura chibensis]|uniref:Uncharacterized protein n=1 Tax=Actinomadura chibensis TaxID=392828 RepID=A0A5D0NXF1_9ACTN|nr:hypothetical protein [Actinomadura chibensis]TYB49310.1 hypothetical protein FXF69_09485 [Actinomadura chibensis]